MLIKDNDFIHEHLPTDMIDFKLLSNKTFNGEKVDLRIVCTIRISFSSFF